MSLFYLYFIPFVFLLRPRSRATTPPLFGNGAQHRLSIFVFLSFATWPARPKPVSVTKVCNTRLWDITTIYCYALVVCVVLRLYADIQTLQFGSKLSLCFSIMSSFTCVVLGPRADMCRFMRQLVFKNTVTADLNVEERNLLSVAYKNVIGARRATWRTINETLVQESQRDSGDLFKLLTTYKQQVCT